MTTFKLGPKGYATLIASEAGPQREVRIVAFRGRGDTGFCDAPMMRAGEPPVAVIDVDKGRNVTAAFGGTVTGGISQIDTGGLGGDGSMSGHTMLAIVADTGTAGI